MDKEIKFLREDVKKIMGAVRNIDHLGRIVLFKEMRDAMDLQNGEAVEMIPLELENYGEGIFIRKYRLGKLSK
ncbi:MAG: hypothetical protein FWC41_00030 [Firmicutes bacterium]|nr:hypothetical protein [Bacillota bacterium]